MPVTARTTSNLAKLGDISTFNVSTTAVSSDPTDSTGSVPNLTATFSNGTDTEYLLGEDVAISAPSIGTFDGEVVSRTKAQNSGVYNFAVDSIMARLNSEQRMYPLADYSTSSENAYLPLYCLEYWTQQCGVFFTKVPGDVLLYQSSYGHFGLFAKDYTRPLREYVYAPGVGGEQGNPTTRYGRVWMTFGYDFDGIASFPKDKYLAVQIPNNTDRLVFGAEIDLVGTSRTADITWQLRRYNNSKPAIRIAVDSEEGFRLMSANDAGAFSTRIISTVPKGDLYSVYASVSQSGADTRFTLSVYDSSGVLRDSQTVLYASEIRGNLSLTSVKYHGYIGGSGSNLAYGNMFVSRMKAAPNKRFPEAKSLTPGTKGAKFLVGFSGNVWEHIKQYCSIYHLDIGLENGKVTVGPRQRDLTVGASLSELSTTFQNREQARSVEVVNQNHKATGGITPAVMWQADSVYQVAVGEVQEFLVQTPHSILSTSQPVCVSGITPYPYKSGAGQYVVTGSDGYIVSPTFWRDQGGSITTDTTENEGEIKITIKGPDYDSPRAPYRISEGDAGRPALYVTGLGILAKPVTLKVGTGKARAAKDVGATLDSPFISDTRMAYDAAAAVSKTLATVEATAPLSEPLAYDKASTLGTSPAGKIVKIDGNIFRMVSASQSHSVLSGSAVQHNTIYQLKRSFGGMTIGQQKDYYAGKTIGQVNIKPIRKAN